MCAALTQHYRHLEMILQMFVTVGFIGVLFIALCTCNLGFEMLKYLYEDYQKQTKNHIDIS